MCKIGKHIWAFSQIISNYICCGSFCFAVTLWCFKFKRFLLALDYDYYAGAYPSINSLLGIYILLPHASISDFSVSQKHIFYCYEKNTVFLFTIESWVFTNRIIQHHRVYTAKTWTDNNDINVQSMQIFQSKICIVNARSTKVVHNECRNSSLTNCFYSNEGQPAEQKVRI